MIGNFSSDSWQALAAWEHYSAQRFGSAINVDFTIWQTAMETFVVSFLEAREKRRGLDKARGVVRMAS